MHLPFGMTGSAFISGNLVLAGRPPTRHMNRHFGSGPCGITGSFPEAQNSETADDSATLTGISTPGGVAPTCSNARVSSAVHKVKPGTAKAPTTSQMSNTSLAFRSPCMAFFQQYRAPQFSSRLGLKAFRCRTLTVAHETTKSY